MKQPILQFIENFKAPFNERELIQTFTQGNCYHFAIILKSLYPNGEIIYDSWKGHFVYLYFDKFYDITGEVIYESHHGLETLEFIRLTDYLWYDRLESDCIYKVRRD